MAKRPIYLDNEIFVELAIKYLHTLQLGRAKPDLRGSGSVMESGSNYYDIEAIKLRLNEIFDLDTKDPRIQPLEKNLIKKVKDVYEK